MARLMKDNPPVTTTDEPLKQGSDETPKIAPAKSEPSDAQMGRLKNDYPPSLPKAEQSADTPKKPKGPSRTTKTKRTYTRLHVDYPQIQVKTMSRVVESDSKTKELPPPRGVQGAEPTEKLHGIEHLSPAEKLMERQRRELLAAALATEDADPGDSNVQETNCPPLGREQSSQPTATPQLLSPLTLAQRISQRTLEIIPSVEPEPESTKMADLRGETASAPPLRTTLPTTRPQATRLTSVPVTPAQDAFANHLPLSAPSTSDTPVDYMAVEGKQRCLQEPSPHTFHTPSPDISCDQLMPAIYSKEPDPQLDLSLDTPQPRSPWHLVRASTGEGEDESKAPKAPVISLTDSWHTKLSHQSSSKASDAQEPPDTRRTPTANNENMRSTIMESSERSIPNDVTPVKHTESCSVAEELAVHGPTRPSRAGDPQPFHNPRSTETEGARQRSTCFGPSPLAIGKKSQQRLENMYSENTSLVESIADASKPEVEAYVGRATQHISAMLRAYVKLLKERKLQRGPRLDHNVARAVEELFVPGKKSRSTGRRVEFERYGVLEWCNRMIEYSWSEGQTTISKNEGHIVLELKMFRQLLMEGDFHAPESIATLADTFKDYGRTVGFAFEEEGDVTPEISLSENGYNC